MMTSSVRIVVVLSLLRTAMGLQQSPPNSVLVSLAMFLTLFVMTPTLTDAYRQGIEPMMNNQVSTEQGFNAAMVSESGAIAEVGRNSSSRRARSSAKQRSLVPTALEG